MNAPAAGCPDLGPFPSRGSRRERLMTRSRRRVCGQTEVATAPRTMTPISGLHRGLCVYWPIGMAAKTGFHHADGDGVSGCGVKAFPLDSLEGVAGGMATGRSPKDWLCYTLGTDAFARVDGSNCPTPSPGCARGPCLGGVAVTGHCFTLAPTHRGQPWPAPDRRDARAAREYVGRFCYQRGHKEYDGGSCPPRRPQPPGPFCVGTHSLTIYCTLPAIAHVPIPMASPSP